VLIQRLSLPALVACISLLAACVGPPGIKAPHAKGTPVAVGPGTPGVLPDSASQVLGGGLISNNAGSLIGKVKIPSGIVSDSGGTLIANNGSCLISDSGLGLISEHGLGLIGKVKAAGVVSNNAGNLVANNGGGLIGKTKYLLSVPAFGLLADDGEVPLGRAPLVIVGADGQPVHDAQGKPFIAISDATGTYRFEHTPVGSNFIVEVFLPTPVGDMTGLLSKEDRRETRSVDVGLASTLVMDYVLGQFVKGDSKVLDRLPAAVEADAQAKVVTAANGQLAVKNFQAAAVKLGVDALRHRSEALDTQFAYIKELLLLGQSNLGNGLPATRTVLSAPTSVSFDGHGGMAIADLFNNRVRYVDAKGVISTLAGTGTKASTGDGGPAVNASLDSPQAVLYGPTGELYVTDGGGHTVRRIKLDGTLETVAGKPGGSDGLLGPTSGAALEIGLATPSSLAWDADGKSLLIGDHNGFTIWRLTPAGRLELVAGRSGKPGSLPALALDIPSPDGLVVEPNGTLTVMEATKANLHVIDAAGQATVRPLNAGSQPLGNPVGLARDAAGNFYTADHDHYRIAKIAPDGTVSTFVGQYDHFASGITDGPATDITLAWPQGLAFDPKGRLVFCDTFHGLVRRVDMTTPNHPVTTIAGLLDGLQSGVDGADLALARPSFAVTAPNGDLLIADTENSVIRRRAPDGTLSFEAGNGARVFSGDGGLATKASFAGVGGLGYDALGNLYVADLDREVRKITPAGIISTLGKTNGNPGPIAVAPDGTVYVGLPTVGRVEQISPDGKVTPLAGTGLDGPDANDGPDATKATIIYPSGLLLDGKGHLFICEVKNLRIRQLDLATGAIQTFTKSAGAPTAMIYGPDGAFYVSDALGGRVLRLSADGGTATVIAGPGGRAFAGDGIDDGLKQPVGLAFDKAGNLFVVDSGNNQIKLVPKSALGI
jgi:sugar lactone lactonase YvrE